MSQNSEVKIYYIDPNLIVGEHYDYYKAYPEKERNTIAVVPAFLLEEAYKKLKQLAQLVDTNDRIK